MTNAPDPDELADHGLPRDPHDYSLRRRGLGIAFWAAMAFGLLCILAGIAIDRYGPKLFPAHAAPTPAPHGVASDFQPAPVGPPPLDAAGASPSSQPAQPSAPALASLTARLDRMDADDQRLRQAAAEALAAAELVAKMEGIIPALETSHAFAKLGSIARDLAAKRGRAVNLVVASSGRGDKDLETLLAHFGKTAADASH